MKIKGISIIFFVITVLIISRQEVDAQKDSIAVLPIAATKVLPSPLTSLPFPGSEWDGAPIIGLPNDQTIYPLLKLLGLAKKKSGIRIYGWVDLGGNLSSSKNSNAPAAYDIVPNSVQLDQLVLRVEREPNTVQTEHADWGFLIDNLYGTDYRYTMATGIFSDQLLKHNDLYGYDPSQFFALLYIPKVADGMLLKAGRFLSPSDIEDQWAPDNYLFSHSLMFTLDPYTFTGIIAIIRLNKNIQFQLGAHGGNDIVPWNNAANLNGLAMVRWVADNNNNSLYGGLPSIGKGYYTYEHDDLQMVVTTWGHRFNDKIHMNTEMYYIWQHNAAVGGTVINGPAESYFMETGPGRIVPGISAAVGMVNYFQILLSPKSYLSIRNDFLNDPQGNRTGFATAYTSHTIGWVHHFNDFITIRPEMRYETAYSNGVTPYDNGTKKNQYIFAADIFVRF